MIIKTILLTIFCVLCSILTFSQTKVLTTDGKTFIVSALELQDDAINITSGDKKQTIQKLNVLAIVPDGKPAYTFRMKNGKKMMIKSKFIHNNYTGTDKPRIFAYKYLGNPAEVSQLYVLNSDSSMTEEQFASVFHAQQKKLKSNNILALGLATLGLLIAIGSFTSTMNQVNDLNNLSNSMN